MAKQWATRVIVAFQSACWCIVILLLLSRGLSNLRYSYSQEVQRAANTTAPADTVESGRGYAVGVCLIIVAALMIIASPAIIVARAYDRRRYRSVEQFPDMGLPPRYEDIVSRAPSYSSLFDDCVETRPEDTNQQQESITTVNVT